MALFRICFGIYWLIPCLMWFPHVELYFSSSGMHFPRFEAPFFYRDSIEQLLASLSQGASAGWAWTLYAITILSLVLLTLLQSMPVALAQAIRHRPLCPFRLLILILVVVR